MNGFGESIRGFFLTIAFVARATVTNVYGHWALAIFSLIAAGAIWVVIQDIENPRVEGLVPDEAVSQGIPVEFVNLAPDYVVEDTARVRVRVEAREDQIPELRPGDFRAVVDLQGVEPGFRGDLPVTVEPLDDSVQVLAVVPARVSVELTRVAEEEFPVTVNITGPLPAGFEESQARVIDPPFVVVSGRPDIVANVDRVEIDVNLSGQREDYQVTGNLVARNRNGDRQTVTLSATRASVSFSISQLTAERLLPVRARVTGSPAPGYRFSSMTVDPPYVTVTGPSDVVDGLTELTVDPVDLSGATSAITQSRSILAPGQVELSRQGVRVDVGISPIVCGGSNSAGEGDCASFTFQVAPRFTNVPTGLVVAPGAYSVRVAVSGPLSALSELSVQDISVTASLAGSTEGSAVIDPEVVVPTPFIVEDVDSVTVTLQSGQVP